MTQCLSVHIVAPSSSPVVTHLLYKPHNAKVSLYSVPALALNCWRYVSGRFRVNSLRITRTPEISRRWMQIAKLQFKSQTEWHPCSIVKNVTGERVGETDGCVHLSFSPQRWTSVCSLEPARSIAPTRRARTSALVTETLRSLMVNASLRVKIIIV